jgi:uncharacterized membrane protein
MTDRGGRLNSNLFNSFDKVFSSAFANTNPKSSTCSGGGFSSGGGGGGGGGGGAGAF